MVGYQIRIVKEDWAVVLVMRLILPGHDYSYVRVRSSTSKCL